MNAKFILFILLCFLAVPAIGKEKMANKFYFQPMLGSAVLSDPADVPAGVTDMPEADPSTALSAAFGYRWHRFSLELLAAHLGKPSVEVGETYREEHNPLFLGVGLHWAWWFFDLKFGWGTVRDETSYERLETSAATFAVTPNNKSSANRGAYFGIGFNFDLGEDTELIFDFTSYAWANDEQRNFTVNSAQTMFSETEHSVGVASLGLRWFI